jgi:hypothetical protein
MKVMTIPGLLNNMVGVEGSSRWYAPENSTGLFKFATDVGNLGFNVVSNLVGKPVADSVANVSVFLLLIFSRN